MDIIAITEEKKELFSDVYPGPVEKLTDPDHMSFAAVDGDKITSFLVSEMLEEEIVIDWIYTVPEYRNKGIATELLEEFVGKIAEHGGPTGIRVVVSGEKSRDFFDNAGFTFESEPVATGYITDFEDVVDLPPAKRSADCKKLSELDDKEMNLLNETLYKTDEPVAIPLPVVASDYADFSYVSIKDDKVPALLLMAEAGKDLVDIAYAYKEEGAVVPLLNLLSIVQEDMEENVSDEMRIRATSINDASKKLMEHMAPEAETENLYMGVRFAI